MLDFPDYPDQKRPDKGFDSILEDEHFIQINQHNVIVKIIDFGQAINILPDDVVFEPNKGNPATVSPE